MSNEYKQESKGLKKMDAHTNEELYLLYMDIVQYFTFVKNEIHTAWKKSG